MEEGKSDCHCIFEEALEVESDYSVPENWIFSLPHKMNQLGFEPFIDFVEDVDCKGKCQNYHYNDDYGHKNCNAPNFRANCR